MIKNKKLYIIIGIIFCIISQSELFSNFSQFFFRRGVDRSNPAIIALGVLSEIISACSNLFNKFIEFLFSWPGEFLIAVILAHINFRKYINIKERI